MSSLYSAGSGGTDVLHHAFDPHERLAVEVTAAFRKDLILEVHAGRTRPVVLVDGADAALTSSPLDSCWAFISARRSVRLSGAMSAHA